MKYREHKIAAMIGPNGELACGWRDWGLLSDATEGWDCDEHEIRRAEITIRVPIVVRSGPVQVEASDAKHPAVFSITDASTYLSVSTDTDSLPALEYRQTTD